MSGRLLVIGLYLHGGDGPMRWGVELLGPLVAHGPEDRATAQRLLDVARDAVVAAVTATLASPGTPAQPSCAWRWRVANVISTAVRLNLPDLDVAGEWTLVHTRGAPPPFWEGTPTRWYRLYTRTRRPITAAERREVRSLPRRERRRALADLAWRRGAYRRSPSFEGRNPVLGHVPPVAT